MSAENNSLRKTDNKLHTLPTILFDRIESVFADSLANTLSSWAHIKSEGEDGEFRSILNNDTTLKAVVLDEPLVDEGSALDNVLEDPSCLVNFSTELREQLELMIARCHDIVEAASIRPEVVQVWAIGKDDVAARQLNFVEYPIMLQSRLSCFKALAKEYDRLGITFNTCIYHPLREELSPKQIKQCRSEMKPYALRYRPIKSNDASQALSNLIKSAVLPMNGAVLYLGTGNMEIGS